MTTRLRMIGAKILGILDPVPLPSPMSEDEGAWVRAHAWTDGLREIEARYPHGFHRWCSCQRGTCWNCLNDRCDICVHRQRGGPDVDEHEPSGSVTDARGYVVALIVLRDGQRPCRWMCRCPCPKTGPAPAPPRKARTLSTSRPAPVSEPAPDHDFQQGVLWESS